MPAYRATFELNPATYTFAYFDEEPRVDPEADMSTVNSQVREMIRYGATEEEFNAFFLLRQRAECFVSWQRALVEKPLFKDLMIL